MKSILKILGPTLLIAFSLFTYNNQVNAEEQNSISELKTETINKVDNYIDQENGQYILDKDGLENNLNLSNKEISEIEKR